MGLDLKVFVAFPKPKEVMLFDKLAKLYHIRKQGAHYQNMYIYRSASWQGLLKFLSILLQYQVKKNSRLFRLKVFNRRRFMGSVLEADEKKVLPSKLGPRFVQKKTLRREKLTSSLNRTVIDEHVLKNLSFVSFKVGKNFLSYIFFRRNFIQNSDSSSCIFYILFYTLFLRVLLVSSYGYLLIHNWLNTQVFRL